MNTLFKYLDIIVVIMLFGLAFGYWHRETNSLHGDLFMVAGFIYAKINSQKTEED